MQASEVRVSGWYGWAMDVGGYDPFAPGRFPVGVRTVHLQDRARGRLFPCEIWYPAQAKTADPSPRRDAVARGGAHPLIVFSHGSGLDRGSAAFLCTHLASHGYVIAAMDHSDVVAQELAGPDGETDTERAARIEAVISARVPDVRFLLDQLLGNGAHIGPEHIRLDKGRVGLVGHSFGGWTVLATTEADPRVRAVAALGPGGSALRGSRARCARSTN